MGDNGNIGSAGDVDPSRPLDSVFEALSHPRRRRCLVLLREEVLGSGDELTLRDLATGTEEFDRVRAELYHVHLPMLEESGYVEWDREAELIRPGPNFDHVAPVLKLLSDHQTELPGIWP